jgi:hypothetical protein
MTTHKDVVSLMKEAHYIITEGDVPPHVESHDGLADHMDGLVLVEAVGHLVSWSTAHATPPAIVVTYWWMVLVTSCCLVLFYQTTSIPSKMGILAAIIVCIEILLDTLFRRLRIRKARRLIHRMHDSLRGISVVAGA